MMPQRLRLRRETRNEDQLPRNCTEDYLRGAVSGAAWGCGLGDGCRGRARIY
jgi:hypothetical protein